MISPTPGRIVWFTPPHDRGQPHFPAGLVHHDRTKPLAAMIVHVWGDRMVNLVVFDSEGKSFPFTSVGLLQDDDMKPEGGRFAAWMPYQVGQAKNSGNPK